MGCLTEFLAVDNLLCAEKNVRHSFQQIIPTNGQILSKPIIISGFYILGKGERQCGPHPDIANHLPVY
jgi:hypothetical protein